jgi:hypothetical protein
MDQPDLPMVQPTAGVHRARFALKLGDRAGMVAEATITSGGLVAVGALVSSIVLASAVIVLAARPSKDRR